MAYHYFTDGKPVITPDSGTVTIDNIRWNLEALRDGILLGDMPGWTATHTPAGREPTTIIYSRGSAAIRGTLSWGTTGAASGNITSAVFYLGSGGPTGTFPDYLGTLTLTYGGAGTLADPGYLQQSYW